MVKSSPFSLFWKAFKTSAKGLSLTMRHLRNSFSKRKVQDIQNEKFFDSGIGTTTLSYPYEAIPVPDHGRYQLYNEIEDCIVCDKCAKVCPVDCIEIEPIKSVGEFGKTSDGTSKRIYAAKFDIDMAKCCFCGLCTTVCPTECLTMTDEYDFSVFNLGKLNFGFGNMTEEEVEEKRQELQADQLKKAALKSEINKEESKTQTEPSGGFPKRPMRPTAIPSPKPIIESVLGQEANKAATENIDVKITGETQTSENPDEIAQNLEAAPKKFSPRMRPVLKSKPPESPETNG